MEHHHVADANLPERHLGYARRVVPMRSRVRGLRQSEARHDVLLARGDLAGAAGARAEWLDQVVSFGITPANDRHEALEKVAMLPLCATARLLERAALDGQTGQVAGAVTVIVGAATAEAERWQEPKPRFELSEALVEDVASGSIPSDPEPLDFERYRRTQRQSFGSAVRQIETVERDIRALDRAGRHELADGGRREPRKRIIIAVCIRAESVAQLEGKQAVLCRHVGLCEPAWLIDPIVGAALLLDYRFLQLSAVEMTRLRDMLPRDAAPVEVQELR